MKRTLFHSSKEGSSEILDGLNLLSDDDIPIIQMPKDTPKYKPIKRKASQKKKKKRGRKKKTGEEEPSENLRGFFARDGETDEEADDPPDRLELAFRGQYESEPDETNDSSSESEFEDEVQKILRRLYPKKTKSRKRKLEEITMMTRDKKKPANEKEVYSLSDFQSPLKKRPRIDQNETGEISIGKFNNIIFHAHDMERCLKGQYLNDSLIDFYIQKYIPTQPNVEIFSTAVYPTIVRDIERSAKKIPKNSLFDNNFALMPINSQNHWFLLIFCYLYDEKSRMILVCDSLGSGGHSQVLSQIRNYLSLRYKHEKSTEMKFSEKNMPCVYAKLPKQKNSSDCGLYMLKYMEEFMHSNCDVEKFKKYPNLFSSHSVLKLRKHLLQDLFNFKLMEELDKDIEINSATIERANRALDDPKYWKSNSISNENQEVPIPEFLIPPQDDDQSDANVLINLDTPTKELTPIRPRNSSKISESQKDQTSNDLLKTLKNLPPERKQQIIQALLSET